MTDLITLTLNPTIDVSYEVDSLVPTKKVRASDERHEPGGGGINVARVFERLGGNAHCHYLAGGPIGLALDRILDRLGLARTRVAISGDTRISSTVFEQSTGQQYRVVAPGPEVAPKEWHECLRSLAGMECGFLAISGSLPRGVPDDFYAQVADLARRHGAKVVLDSSGRGLAGGLAGGAIYLVKPNLLELESIAERKLTSEDEVTEAAMAIVERGWAEYAAVTLGADGALLVSAEGALRVPAIPIAVASAVGAGDSFVAGMVHALARGWDMPDAFRLGIAAGAAALITEGTELAHAQDVTRLYESAFGS